MAQTWIIVGTIVGAVGLYFLLNHLLEEILDSLVPIISLAIIGYLVYLIAKAFLGFDLKTLVA